MHADLFTDRLGEALAAVEDLDSDEDGFTNLQEIEAGTSPSDAASAPEDAECRDRIDDGYALCGYDLDYAFKKVTLDFCGRSPTLAEREAFADEDEPEQALHDALDACLDSEHWRGVRGQVWNLANSKINPQRAVKAGLEPGPIPLADYDDDYAYFVWTQTDGRDARLVLTGQSFVSARYVQGLTVYEEWDRNPAEDQELRGYDRYQAVQRDRRAGLLTHRWFLMSNTMFTAVPRTTGAQAYRAFLGYDIARLEGLYPVNGEPEDYDDKGVGAEACAVCHSTLDPLTYPFSRYEGIGGGRGASYSYSPSRLSGFTDVDGPRVVDTPEAGVLFGEPVADLLEWAQVAAESEAFRRATVRDYWRLLMREDPRPSEQAEFGALVQGFGEANAYSVEAMLHDLIDTEAYGAP
ncbi:MAG: hypothetical protein H6741_32740 [Alphaproteobacteria bacterium]|nr:hypothetical protein [Alphaproteobacteria bacterium]MCB9797484.1 hypothetical protein [Alphaproteobacteria bacterium]